MISCSSLAATSAWADTRSSGGDWPTSTLALLTRASSCDEAQRRGPRLHVRDRRHQRPVHALHVGRRVHDALAQPRAGDVAVDAARDQLLPRRVDEQIAHQRLRDVQREARLHERVVAVQEAVAVGVDGVPRDVVRRAVPGQPLAEPGARCRRRRSASASGIRKLDGGCSWLLRLTPELNVGRNCARWRRRHACR